MLSEAVGDLLIAAAAVALSPIPIIGVVLMLGTPRARTVGLAFAAGWVAALSVVSVIVVVAFGDADDPDSSAATGVDWLDVAIGVVFLLLAAMQWRKRPKPGQPAKTPSWMGKVDTVTPGRAALLGLVLAGANPKNLALTFAAAASIAEAGLDRTDTVIAVAAFVALASVTVAGSVLFYVASPSRAERPLAAVKRFMGDNSATIMVVILLLLGAKLLGNGLGGLWS
jgi:threonine/homoserine/homoserine lactone efflux protein